MAGLSSRTRGLASLRTTPYELTNHAIPATPSAAPACLPQGGKLSALKQVLQEAGRTPLGFGLVGLGYLMHRSLLERYLLHRYLLERCLLDGYLLERYLFHSLVACVPGPLLRGDKRGLKAEGRQAHAGCRCQVPLQQRAGVAQSA